MLGRRSETTATRKKFGGIKRERLHVDWSFQKESEEGDGENFQGGNQW